MTASIVSLRNVTRAFDGDVFALRDVSLDIARGELMAIVGPSGSGKSTMLNIIGTLDRASMGDVVIDGLKVAELKDSDLSALRQVGLGHRLDHRPHQLSGGERQRTAIARALVRRPLLLLADEPTGALDTASGEGVLQLLLELHREGTAVVVITHDRDLAARFDRQVSMRDGQLVEDPRRGAA